MVERIAKILFVKIANDDDLILLNREARCGAPSENDFPLKTHWAALCAATKNFKKSEKSLILEHIYVSARTYFIKNS